MSGNKDNVLIEVQKLTKSFGGNVVLDGISTDIRKGEVWPSSALPVPENPHFLGR